MFKVNTSWLDPKTSYTRSEAAQRAQTVSVYAALSFIKHHDWSTEAVSHLLFFPYMCWAILSFNCCTVPHSSWMGCHNDVINIHPAETFSCECIYHEITWSFRSASSYVDINLQMNRQVTASSHFHKSHQGLDVTSCLLNYFTNNFCLLIIITTCGSKAFVKLLYRCNCMQQNLLQEYYLRKTVPKNPTWQLISLKQNSVLQIRWITNISTQKWFPKTAKKIS